METFIFAQIQGLYSVFDMAVIYPMAIKLVISADKGCSVENGSAFIDDMVAGCLWLLFCAYVLYRFVCWH